MVVRFIEKTVTVCFDIAAVTVAFAATFWLRYKSHLFNQSFDSHIDISSFTQPMLILAGCWIVLFFLCGLYRDWYRESRLDEIFVVARGALIGIFLMFVITGAPQIVAFLSSGRLSSLFTPTKVATILTYGGLIFLFAAISRFGVHTFLSWLLSRGIGQSNVLIIGANPSGEELLHDLQRYPQLGHRVVGFVDDDGRKKNTQVSGLPVLGHYSDIRTLVKQHQIRGIIISRVSASPNEILRILEYCGDLRITIHVVPSLMDVIAGHLKTHQIFGMPLNVLLQDHLPPWQAQIKRAIDICMSLLVLGLGAPLWLAIVLLIRLTSPGKAMYSQERIGQYGKPFTIYKFRSMYIDAEKRSGPQWATKNDPRITPVGRFVRKTRIDEIPQFINVLKGEMSLVGPRPERAFFIEQLKKEIPWYVQRIKMKPGITGWAQVKHKYDTSIEDVKQKVIYDLYYFENMSLMLDIKIIIRTLWVVLVGKGAH